MFSENNFNLTDASSVCSSTPSLSELDCEFEKLEQEQAAKFITDETLITVLDIADGKPQNGTEPRTLESGDEITSSHSKTGDQDTLLMPPPCIPIGRPTAESLGLREYIEEHMSIKSPEEDKEEEEINESGELDLTGIDDEELDLVSIEMLR